jgi:hypothetical protein
MEKPGFFSTTQQGQNTKHFLFYFPSVAEMMIGAMMMKVIQTLTTCMNML